MADAQNSRPQQSYKNVAPQKMKKTLIHLFACFLCLMRLLYEPDVSAFLFPALRIRKTANLEKLI